MMWRSSDITALSHKMLRMLQLVVMLSIAGNAGMVVRTQFLPHANGSADSNLVVKSQEISLAVKYNALLKLYGDTLPGTPNRSFYPELTIKGNDTFDVQYVDTTIVTPRVATQRLIVAPTGVVTAGFPTKWFDCRYVSSANYLHADYGATDEMASIIKLKQDNDFPYLQLNNGTASINVDTTRKYGFLYTSQNVFSGDTFLVASCIDAERALLKKVYSRGLAISVTGEVEAFTGVKTADSTLLNCTVAADSLGTIFMGVVRGGPSTPKYMEYAFYSRDLIPGARGRYAVPIGENTMYYYDDFTAVSYGTGKFAVVSWDAQGILLHRISTDGTTASHQVTRVITKNGVKFCTIAASAKYMVIACRGDLDGNGVRGIEGIRYKMVNGQPDSGVTVSFSDPTTPVLHPDSSKSSAINGVVNDSGTMALVWRNQYKVNACVWAERHVRFESGFYLSPVESLINTIDSVQFHPVVVPLSSTASWNTSNFLRFGATPAACSNAPWLSFSDSLLLSRNRTAHCYYQHKTYINRNGTGSIDSFSTPYVRSVHVAWNTKPRMPQIDSVIINGIHESVSGIEDTLTAVARRDTVMFHALVYDDDVDDSVSFTATLQAVPSLQKVTGGGLRKVQVSLLPLQKADTVYYPQLIATDRDAWQGKMAGINIKTFNVLPRLSVRWRHRDGRSAVSDSAQIENDTAILIASEDTFWVNYAVTDSNDQLLVTGRLGYGSRGNIVTVDSINSMENGLFSVSADTLPVQDTIHYRIEAVDPDTIMAITMHVVINHPPVIDGIVYRDDTLENDDTVNVVIDDTAQFRLLINDPDCAWWDTLRYRYTANGSSGEKTSTSVREVMSIVPDSLDTLITFSVADRFGRNDSMRLYCVFPWLETDSSVYPPYLRSIRYAATAVSLIAGSGSVDNVAIPLKNTGRDVLRLSSFSLTGGNGTWVTVRFPGGTDTFTVTKDTSDSPELLVIPGGIFRLSARFFASAVIGDAVRRDTLQFSTNDPRHARVRIPLMIEYNDLPRIVSVTPTFMTDIPYRPLSKRAAYTFPPHAALSIAFSEPMDTSSTDSGIQIHSEYDRTITGMKEPIPLKFEWIQNGSVALVSPAYVKSSPAFRLLPPQGLFIPTDSVVVTLSSILRDRATTPNGPNRLDVNRDFVRDSAADTSIGLRIDSIGFTIASIDPPAGHLRCPRMLAVRLTLSSPLYAASVDTARVDNKSFEVRSIYNNNRRLQFTTVTHDSVNVIFTLEKMLFYDDSVTCTYNSRYLRDRLGYAADNDRDGIDATIFDILATEDNLVWGYRVKPLLVSSVDPAPGVVVTEVSPLITLRFDDKIISGIFDSDTSKQNRSFRIGSGRTGYSSLRQVTVLPDSMTVTIQPKLAFFSNDSVYCKFTGFSNRFNYDREINLPQDTNALASSFSWHFRSGEIGFYTYPNPYLPATDKRHCSANGPCGIWFKNLHTLAKELDEVIIKIYTMNAHPVFDSQKKGVRIRFSDEGSEILPEWKWDTRNNRGEFVASGIYLYGIYDVRGTTLIKGKCIIAR